MSSNSPGRDPDKPDEKPNSSGHDGSDTNEDEANNDPPDPGDVWPPWLEEQLVQLFLQSMREGTTYECGKCGGQKRVPRKNQEGHVTSIPHRCPWLLERVNELMEQSSNARITPEQLAEFQQKVENGKLKKEEAPSGKRGPYDCGKCKLPKKGHTCEFTKGKDDRNKPAAKSKVDSEDARVTKRRKTNTKTPLPAALQEGETTSTESEAVGFVQDPSPVENEEAPEIRLTLTEAEVTVLDLDKEKETPETETAPTDSQVANPPDEQDTSPNEGQGIHDVTETPAIESAADAPPNVQAPITANSGSFDVEKDGDIESVE